MGLKQRIRGMIVALVVERPVAGLTLGDLAARLERDGVLLAAGYATTPDTERNRRVLSHIVGIERWGQRRLRALLGEPPSGDEYNGYRPARELSIEALRGLFEETRRDTLAILLAMRERGVDLSARVTHDEHGPLTVRGWMHYLNSHANMESKRLRG